MGYRALGLGGQGFRDRQVGFRGLGGLGIRGLGLRCLGHQRFVQGFRDVGHCGG